MWMWLVLVYGILKGFREIVKKKSLEKSSVAEVLFFYTLIGFLFVIPGAFSMKAMEPVYYAYIFIKSFIIFMAWICSFKAIRQLPISLYGILDLSRVLFATLLGVIVLGEVLNFTQVIGLLCVLFGLLLLKWHPGKRSGKQQYKKTEVKYILFAFISCILNAVSGLMDKILMKEIDSTQLQFWYMLFLVALYGGYLLLSREKIQFAKAATNKWIWLLAFLFVVADRCLFLANASPDSRITVMTLIKQSGCLVTLAAGKWLYHDKNVGHKALCTALVVAGIVVAVL